MSGTRRPGLGHEAMQTEQLSTSTLDDFTQHQDLRRAAVSLAWNLELGRAELVEKQAVLSISYTKKDNRLFAQDGTAFQDLIDPSDHRRVENFEKLHPAFLAQLKTMERVMCSNQGISQMAIVSPDDPSNPSGRSYLYLYKNKGSTVEFSAIEAPSSPEELTRFLSHLAPPPPTTTKLPNGREIYAAKTFFEGSEITLSKTVRAAIETYIDDPTNPKGRDLTDRLRSYYEKGPEQLAAQAARVEKLAQEILEKLAAHPKDEHAKMLVQIAREESEKINDKILPREEAPQAAATSSQRKEPAMQRELEPPLPQESVRGEYHLAQNREGNSSLPAFLLTQTQAAQEIAVRYILSQPTLSLEHSRSLEQPRSVTRLAVCDSEIITQPPQIEPVLRHSSQGEVRTPTALERPSTSTDRATTERPFAGPISLKEFTAISASIPSTSPHPKLHGPASEEMPLIKAKFQKEQLETHSGRLRLPDSILRELGIASTPQQVSVHIEMKPVPVRLGSKAELLSERVSRSIQYSKSESRVEIRGVTLIRPPTGSNTSSITPLQKTPPRIPPSPQLPDKPRSVERDKLSTRVAPQKTDLGSTRRAPAIRSVNLRSPLLHKTKLRNAPLDGRTLSARSLPKALPSVTLSQRSRTKTLQVLQRISEKIKQRQTTSLTRILAAIAKKVPSELRLLRKLHVTHREISPERIQRSHSKIRQQIISLLRQSEHRSPQRSTPLVLRRIERFLAAIEKLSQEQRASTPQQAQLQLKKKIILSLALAHLMQQKNESPSLLRTQRRYLIKNYHRLSMEVIRATNGMDDTNLEEWEEIINLFERVVSLDDRRRRRRAVRKARALRADSHTSTLVESTRLHKKRNAAPTSPGPEMIMSFGKGSRGGRGTMSKSPLRSRETFSSPQALLSIFRLEVDDSESEHAAGSLNATVF